MPCEHHPWTFRGSPESGGVLRPKDAPTTRHPNHKGRLYVVGYGWLWLSGWQQQDGSVRLAAEAMTTEQVEHYCRPDGPGRAPVPADGPGRGPGAAPGKRECEAEGFDWQAAEQEQLALGQGTHAHASTQREGRGGGGPREPRPGSHPTTEGPSPSHGEDFDDDIPF